MNEINGLQLIKTLRSKWIRFSLLANAMPAAGAAVLVAVLLNRLYGSSGWWGIAFFVFIYTSLLLVHRPWKRHERQITNLLDQTYPQLEESAGLLLHPQPNLNILQQLQYNKTGKALLTIPSPLPGWPKLVTPLCVMVLLLAASRVLVAVSLPTHTIALSTKATIASRAGTKEKRLAQVAGVNIEVVPPAYTKKSSSMLHTFSLVAQEGAEVEWHLQTNAAAAKVLFVFNDSLKVVLHPSDKNHRTWVTSRKIDSTGFYQVNIDGQLSELYKIEIIPDHPPVVVLQSPKQYTTIDIGEPQQVKISTTLTDDYGLKDASITATIATGSGEAVKFKEQKISLPGFTPGKMQYQLQQMIYLQTFGMQPGDELYFYIQATDSHQQQTRSDIYIVQLPDTAQLMSLDGLANSLTLKPEYFRSQRQIIIETEQLLKEKDTISAEAFKNRCNNLGIDQKLLRLRYGKFLGDEAESGETNVDDVAGIADFSNAEKIRDAFTDKHDNAEDATFYAPETKKQLKATLTEMWNAEIQLRTFVPQTALAFEYKALRLLKDLQQQSRAYVAKTNFKTAPLDPKKRLTGDLTKIDEISLQKNITAPGDQQAPVRRALSLLNEMAATATLKNDTAGLLEKAGLYLQQHAIHEPARYLPAVEAIKKITRLLRQNVLPPPSQVSIASKGLRQVLSIPVIQPSAGTPASKQVLSGIYFDNLQKTQP